MWVRAACSCLAFRFLSFRCSAFRLRVRRAICCCCSCCCFGVRVNRGGGGSLGHASAGKQLGVHGSCRKSFSQRNAQPRVKQLCVATAFFTACLLTPLTPLA